MNTPPIQMSSQTQSIVGAVCVAVVAAQSIEGTPIWLRALLGFGAAVCGWLLPSPLKVK